MNARATEVRKGMDSVVLVEFKSVILVYFRIITLYSSSILVITYLYFNNLENKLRIEELHKNT